MTARLAHELYVLSAGAAKGLVEAMAAPFAAQSGVTLRSTFGAVGAIREKLLAGDRCDALILTEAMIDQLATSGHVVPETQAALGRVRTGVGVRDGDALPDITSAVALARTLRQATEIFVPDMQRSTAGIHFARVLDQLGVHAEVASRLTKFENGAAAMHALAHSAGAMPIGCTQASEIKYTQGVTLVGPLPPEFELSTVYSIALCSASKQPTVARQFVAWLGGPDLREARTEAGFDI